QGGRGAPARGPLAPARRQPAGEVGRAGRGAPRRGGAAPRARARPRRPRPAAAEQQLAVALARLDRYFATILADQTDAAGEGAVRALAERRRTEEVRRNQVRAMVHPLQLVDATVLIQRAEWEVESGGHRATFSAQRSAAGAGDWIFACPQCGT